MILVYIYIYIYEEITDWKNLPKPEKIWGNVDKPNTGTDISSLFIQRLYQITSDSGEFFGQIKTKYQLNPLSVFVLSTFPLILPP